MGSNAAFAENRRCRCTWDIASKALRGLSPNGRDQEVLHQMNAKPKCGPTKEWNNTQ